MIKATYDICYLVFNGEGKRIGHGNRSMYCKKSDIPYLMEIWYDVKYATEKEWSMILTSVIRVSWFDINK